MEKVLIIGGCGYIGSRLYQFLLQQGMDIQSVDFQWFGQFSNFTNQPSDFRHLSKEYLKLFDVVVLLAGHSSVQMCVGNMISCFENNVRNFLTLLEKLSPKQKFIYASSSSIYGGINDEYVSEDCPKYRALNFYDLSKYEIDKYVVLHDSLEYYGLRFGTVNGFSPNFRDDIMINAMYKTAVCDQVVRIRSPKLFRPILGLSDLCQAVLSIIRHGNMSKRGIFNLASFNSTVGEIGKSVSHHLEVALEEQTSTPNAYDFTISCEKFIKTFDFKFESTVENILNEILRSQSQINFTNRKTAIKYG
jgi:UDP-glucose 4-epimerase